MFHTTAVPAATLLLPRDAVRRTDESKCCNIHRSSGVMVPDDCKPGYGGTKKRSSSVGRERKLERSEDKFGVRHMYAKCFEQMMSFDIRTLHL